MNNLLSRITQIPGQCGGRPCIRGMRIRVSDIEQSVGDRSNRLFINYLNYRLSNLSIAEDQVFKEYESAIF
uniref:DUF433 domain-containing protein n=1 Tax=Cyanothece sp. (strain PCC 7425 / ATCC 29141) TaxID=395961 RepID=B8HML9_CYAP4